jgi:general secretion pathway protein I
MPRDAGFTLLEVMVAFVIAALASIVLIHAGLEGTASAVTAGRTEEATTRAESRLASIGVLTPLQTERLDGDDGNGFGWRLAIAPIMQNGATALYTVTVTETYGDRTVSLTTERLGPSS